MPDMTSTGRVLLAAALASLSLTLAGCKSLPFGGEKTAALATPETPEVPETGKPKAQAKTAAAGRSGYVDPYVATAGGRDPAPQVAQTLPGSEEAAGNIGGLVTQPTGIKAGQSSIFSTGVTAAPATATDSQNGAMLPATAYSPTPGVNATLYSVYGNGRRATGAETNGLQ